MLSSFNTVAQKQISCFDLNYTRSAGVAALKTHLTAHSLCMRCVDLYSIAKVFVCVPVQLGSFRDEH